ncbi:DNA-directed RNA polymerase subunit alpha [Candidatus Oleimmundimicrobium sp.]|uniref:DNA-directed RNA polymerase subunit alpha n=1 Tax=Candidatus Oleimmundimicrobium sp. TaxID=3060597 RepID=UPI0027182213|nr:DNA-directed RNA polymerase subunit alpha [Candidatus Oleimmundimicrobium sp.]MDO8886035.1 DNA-directed RNA polymerase subunit alpha [Candidatus Oleimmundimicrobium sp.]
MIDFLKPRVSVEAKNDFDAIFVVDPLERGFGYSLGNSMRRILLSSLPGAAVTSVRFEGVTHEFSTIPGVRDDVIDVILNIKEIVVRSYSEEPVTMKLNVKGPKEVKAGDIKCPSDIEIVNPDLYLATLNKGAKLEVEMVVEKGRGYVTAERNKKSSMPIGVIPIDSIFSPVKRVAYTVENTRVGQRTDYDKLRLEVETNGSLTADEIVSLAAKIMKEHMDLFIDRAPEKAESTVFEDKEEVVESFFDAPIEDLDLSVRSYNCLKRQGISTLQQLSKCTENDLINIRNFGAKSIQEIKEKLASFDLGLEKE